MWEGGLALDYTSEIVEAVLPLLFDNGHGLDGSLGLGGGSIEPGMPRAKRDPSTCGDLACMCADVLWGLRRLPVLWRNIVFQRVALGRSLNAIAMGLGVDRGSVSRIVSLVPSVVADMLNGEDYMFPVGRVSMACKV